MTSYNKTNLMAGAFLLGGLALAVWMSFMLSDRSAYASVRRFTVRFELGEGVTGLKHGSPVYLGGKDVGRVLGVEFIMNGGEGGAASGSVPEALAVKVEIRSDVTLYDGAGIYLDRPLLGNLSSLNIASVGDAGLTLSGGSPRIEDGDVIEGRIAPPAFLAQAGFGPEQAAMMKETIRDVQATARRASEMVERVGPELESAATEIDSLARDVRTRAKDWAASIDTIMADMKMASGKVNPLLDESHATVVSLRAMVDENRETVDGILASARKVAERLDTEVMESIQSGVRDATAALNGFSRTLTRVDELMASEAPGVRRSMANFRLMSDQLKLAAIEIRSQPWRLLIRPESKELSAQLLYDSTRAYAQAASDLKAASESLEALMATAGDVPGAGVGRESLDEVSRTLTEAQARYKEAEAALLDRLIRARE